MTIKQEINNLIGNSLVRIGAKRPRQILVRETKNDKFGDYSSNIALAIESKRKRVKSKKTEKKLKKNNSKSIANDIVKNLPKNKTIEKADVAGTGFINFWVKEKYLKNQIPKVLNEDDKFGSSDMGKGKKVLVEFISANPTGPLHLGNARGGPLGDVIANILEKSEYAVSREFYVNDVVRQADLFAKSIIARMKDGEIPKDGYPGEYVAELAEKLKDEKDKGLENIRKKAIALMLDEMKETAEKMGIKFDGYEYESEYLKSGKTGKVANELKERTEKKEGALWLSGSVLKRSEGGDFTYFANDIAYHKDKFDRGYGKLIDVWGANHHGHVARMKEAIKAIGENPDNLDIVLYQYVHLREAGEIKKMAKREGTYITANQVLEVVPKDVFRMMMIMTAPETHLEFDLKLAQEQSKKNPVFYIQYAHARINSILRNANKKQETRNKKQTNSKFEIRNSKLLNHKTEIELLKELIKFPDLVEEVGESYEVHRLPYYAINLSKKFHRFYKCCRVLQAESEELKEARLALTKATKIVLKNVLDLMGIEAPERM